MSYQWRVTVLTLPDQQRKTLRLSTESASARDAHRAALEILQSWPPGSRVVGVAPCGRELWLTNDASSACAGE